MHTPLFASFHQWRLIFRISYGAWLLLEAWIFARDRRPATGTRRDMGSVAWIVCMIVLGVTMSFFAPHSMPAAAIVAPPRWLFTAAIFLIWGGIVLRLWAVLTLGELFRTTVFIQDTHRLITWGPYRWLRHPSYSGALVILIGIGLAMGNWLSLIAILSCGVVAFRWRIMIEEAALSERFGAAFDAYHARSWAVIPFLW